MLATDIIDVVDESFSALQRAEIAEICAPTSRRGSARQSVSVLFNEPKLLKSSSFDAGRVCVLCFSALQRAEIAEMLLDNPNVVNLEIVSVLFNEPKLLKSEEADRASERLGTGFSALQRAEIAEIPKINKLEIWQTNAFQCSSTSRNC